MAIPNPTLKKPKTTATATPIKNTVIRLVVISDTHGHHELLNESMASLDGDVLIHCGDFTDRGSIAVAHDFVSWISQLAATMQYKEILVIGGNHDRNLKQPETLDLKRLFTTENASNGAVGVPSNVYFLQDELHISPRTGLKVFGASWESCESGTFDATSGIDILLAHMPPYISSRHLVIQDQLGGPYHSKGWKGSRELSRTVMENEIPLCLSGHLHWSRGALKMRQRQDTRDTVATATSTAPQPREDDSKNNKNYIHQSTKHSSVGSHKRHKTWFVNAASLWSNRQGEEGVTKPVIIDYDLETRTVVGMDCEPHPR